MTEITLKLPNYLTENAEAIGLAIGHITQSNHVALSQCTQEVQDSALGFFESLFLNAQETVRKAGKLNNLKKDVFFAKNIDSTDELCVHPGKRMPDGSIQLSSYTNVTDESIVDADVLVIAPADFHYDPAATTQLNNVEVQVLSKRPNNPTKVLFWSGGTYFLTSGFSVKACMYLNRTVKLELSKKDYDDSPMEEVEHVKMAEALASEAKNDATTAAGKGMAVVNDKEPVD